MSSDQFKSDNINPEDLIGKDLQYIMRYKKSDKDNELFAYIDSWVSIEYDSSIIDVPENKVFGTHLCAFVFVNCKKPIKGSVTAIPGVKGEVKCRNVFWMVKDSEGRFVKTKSILDDEEFHWWFYNYDTLCKFNFELIEQEEVLILGLPDPPEICDNLSSAEQKNFRTNKALHPYRKTGHPDYIKVFFIYPDHKVDTLKIPGEIMWVFYEKDFAPGKYLGRLRNNAHHCNLKEGDQVEFSHVEIDGEFFPRSWSALPLLN